jgi:HEAT repeat protein
MPETSSVDAAIGRYLRQPDSESARSLAATGEAGVRRLLSLRFGDAHEPFDNPIPDVSSRAAIDRWSSALSIVARAAPAAFTTGIAGRAISLNLLAILGDVDDPRATTILCQYVSDEDWLSRYNAVSSLGRRNDAASRPCIERALGDPNLVVRTEAIKAISRWDAHRAASLYEELLDTEGLTPLLRSEAHAAIGDLRAGLPAREPWDR